jgi:hypothetical protein
MRVDSPQGCSRRDPRCAKLNLGNKEVTREVVLGSKELDVGTAMEKV